MSAPPLPVNLPSSAGRGWAEPGEGGATIWKGSTSLLNTNEEADGSTDVVSAQGVQHDEEDRLVMIIGGGNYGFFASLRPASATATGLQ